MDGGNNSGLSPFEPGDTSTVSARWKKWKRSFQIFLDVNNVTIAARKKSYLLHYVGPQVQDVYFSLQGDAEPAVPANSDEYKEAVKLLDGYFLPMKCLPLERHKFRNLVQATDEPIENFVLRLREQGNLCEYGDHLEEEIKEQIFERGSSDDLRAKILNKPQMNLAETVEVGRALETIEKHKNNAALCPIPEDVHRIRSKTRKQECYRCGQLGHFANDDKCPAKDRKCKRCGLIGHFKSCCKTKNKKQKNRVSGKDSKHREAARNVSDSDDSDDSEQQSGSDSEEESIRYLFATEPAKQGEAVCAVGGVHIAWVIDSGAGLNIVDRRTWEYLKAKKVHVHSQTAEVKRTVKSFTGHSVSIAGMFSAEVATKHKRVKADIYVVEDGTCCLLGRETATALGMLTISDAVCVASDSDEDRSDSRKTSNGRGGSVPDRGSTSRVIRSDLERYTSFEELLAADR